MMRRSLCFIAIASTWMAAPMAAHAELCLRCQDQVFQLSFGQCQQCSEQILGGMRFCPACSDMLGRCEACGQSIVPLSSPEKPAEIPATLPAPATASPDPAPDLQPALPTQPTPPPEPLPTNLTEPQSPATRPAPSTTTVATATKPALSPLSAVRAAALKANAETFMLSLKYHGRQNEPYTSLFLSVRPQPLGLPVNSRLITIDTDTAKTIIDHLARTEWLNQASDVSGRLLSTPPGPCYTLTVHAGPMALHQQLEWDLTLINSLDVLGLALSGKAADALQALLLPLEPLREEGEQAFSVRGLKLEVTADKPLFAPGEPVLLNLNLENYSDDPIAVYAGEFRNFWHAHVFGPGVLLGPDDPTRPPADEGAFIIIETEQSRSVTVALRDIGPRPWLLEQPGTYRVNLVLQVEPAQLDRFRQPSVRPVGKWIGRIISATVLITIGPQPQDQPEDAPAIQPHSAPAEPLMAEPDAVEPPDAVG